MAKRRHKKRPMPVVCMGESATPERRMQLGGLMTEVVADEGSGRRFTRQRAKNIGTLELLFELYRINEAQFMAGLKVREIHDRAMDGKGSKVLCNPFPIDAGQGGPEWKIIARMDSMRLLSEAFAVLTQAQRNIIEAVCVYDKSAKNKDEKETLLRGLDRLAEYWSYV